MDHSTTKDTIQVIDGSTLEGGGQILRNAISLAALLRKPIRIENIRAGRAKPGLKNQHRTGLELVARISSGTLTGASNESMQVEFIPGKIELPGEWKADSVTAGATTLLMQIAFPLLLFKSSPSLSTAAETNTGPSILRLLGGTNAGQAPQVDYTQHVFLHFFRTHFLRPSASSSIPNSPSTTTPTPIPSVELEIRKRGYFPKGGGELQLRVQPLQPGEKLRPVILTERGRLLKVGGIAHCAGLPRVVGEGMRQGAVKMIKECIENSWCPDASVTIVGPSSSEGGEQDGRDGDEERRPAEVVVDITVKREPNQLTKGAGSGIVIWAEFENGIVLGGSAVGKKGIEPADVGKAAVEELNKGVEAGGCVEEWMQDQMIIFMALAEGKSEVRCGKDGLSLHTRTAIWVAEQLTNAKFEVMQDGAGHWIIRCEGIGFTGQ